jgi:predicted SAM-dependent methyltransferase
VAPGIKPIVDVHKNVHFFNIDLCKDTSMLPPVELVVSADFFEHLETDKLVEVVKKVDALSRQAFHKIACYDDGNCHNTVWTPNQWLDLFRSIDHSYAMERIEYRAGLKAKPIVVIVKRLPDALRGPLKLHYGCGDVRLPGYVGVDVRAEAKGADIVTEAWDVRPFRPGSVDEIYSRHMLEHLTLPDAKRTLEAWCSLLKPDGLLRVIVPDLEFHARQLLGQGVSWKSDPKHNFDHAMAGFYGWQRTGWGGSQEDAHRWGYTYASLRALLTSVGFRNVDRVKRGTDSEPWHLHVTAIK